MERQHSNEVVATQRKVWQDPELSILEIDETLSTVPPGSDSNAVGS